MVNLSFVFRMGLFLALTPGQLRIQSLRTRTARRSTTLPQISSMYNYDCIFGKQLDGSEIFAFIGHFLGFFGDKRNKILTGRMEINNLGLMSHIIIIHFHFIYAIISSSLFRVFADIHCGKM